MNVGLYICMYMRARTHSQRERERERVGSFGKDIKMNLSNSNSVLAIQIENSLR